MLNKKLSISMRKIKLISAFVFAAALSFGLTVRANDNVKTDAPESVQQGRTVAGTVSDAAGAVMGASVSVKGTSNGTVTDSDGRFTLRNVASGSTIVVSFLGYKSQEIKYTGQTSLAVTLEEDAQQLGEVVVTALGITKDAKKLGYAVSTISSDDLVKVGAPNFGTALYGKASGVRISSPPGGAASGVSFTVRGLSSINGNTQPLIVFNGVPIRSGNDEGSTASGLFASFGSEGRIRSNGLVDINPEDIESISILKGAAATALYGSEGANGVVLVTSKKNRGSGITVNANATLEANTMAYLPKVQTEYGPGLYSVSQNSTMLERGGFTTTTYKGQEYVIPYYATNVSFGPKYDGREVLYWDGNMRPYQAYTNDPWSELFRTGFDQIYNVAINQGSDNTSNRFSYTFLDEIPNGLTGSYKKHNFNFVGNMKINKTLAIDYSVNYLLQNVHNRAQRSTSAYDSFSNLFGSMTDISLMKKMYKTSLGYKNRVSGDPTLTPDESFAFSPGTGNWVKDYLWSAYMNNDYETSNRLIASVAPSWKITDYLSARARISTDYTADKMEFKNATERPLVLEDPSGSYIVNHKQYAIFYGDGMLVFDKNLTDKINISANFGYQARQENMQLLQGRTNGGLTIENMFNFAVSRDNTTTSLTNMEMLKTAFLGTIDFAFDDYLFLGVTGRSEKTSTLPVNFRTYFYPSANASFLYTSAFKESMPDWYDYGKLRFSYGVVGNAPDPYAANIVYDAGSSGGVQYSSIPSTLGNEELKPEKITEFEVGLENKMFHNRVGFELSLYHRRISDMLLPRPLNISDGASNMNVNIGEMVNQGVEFSFNVSPIETKDLKWNIRANFAFNKNEITNLVEGVEYIRNSGTFGNTGGGANIRSYVGRPMGDIYVNKITRVTDESSPYYGEKIVVVPGHGETEGWGYYLSSTGEAAQECVGNINPKIIGGLGTSLLYKHLSLDIMTDFRIGGMVLNNADLYPNCRGLTTKTLQYRDAEHGGLTYTYNGMEMHNGWIVPGVYFDEATGQYKPNDIITSIDSYYYLTYNWGNSDPGVTYELSVHENSYWKVRELALGYDLPKSIIQNARMKELTVSLFGRNLFYLYKTLDDIDPESTNGGTTWGGQAGVGYSSSPTRTFGVSLRATF
jgi:TonB-linked SusC/RagA family outer membrane protein